MKILCMLFRPLWNSGDYLGFVNVAVIERPGHLLIAVLFLFFVRLTVPREINVKSCQ